MRIGDTPRDGALARLGLRPGDIVRRVNQKAVGASLSLSQALAAAAGPGPDAVLIELDRNGQRAVRSLPLK